MKYLFIVLAFYASGAFGSKYPYLPDRALTPGAVASTDRAVVCQKNYTKITRKVSESKRIRVYKLHKIDKARCTKGCKIDHLIPLAIGGSNDIENLWPHEYGAEWSVANKTRLEIKLRKEVCAGRLPIKDAQECIRSDWTRCYEKFYPH